jgi:hypothetical protein
MCESHLLTVSILFSDQVSFVTGSEDVYWFCICCVSTSQAYKKFEQKNTLGRHTK